MDQKQIAHAISDFSLFLSGQKAPALVAQSLATVINLDMSEICKIVFNWAYRNPNLSLPEAVLAARNKVFDIFFYRITKFEKIHKFFPEFEKALIASCTFEEDRAQLAYLFQTYRWQDIRPIGHIRDQQQFMMELRKSVCVQTEQFNEDIYKHATFNLLSVNKYQFDNEQVASNVIGYQTKLKAIFNDFVELVDDKKLKQEILLANEADRNNVYEQKQRFKPEEYLLHMTDMAIALFNDDFLQQAAQIFSVIQDLVRDHKLKLKSIAKFQEKGNLLNHQKLEDYANTRVGCYLVRQIIRHLEMFDPGLMLMQLQIEESRRVRRLLLKALECYGQQIYGTLVSELSGKYHQVPWYYNRNLVYLLGRIPCSNAQYANQVVELLDMLWQPKTERQLVTQIISTLGFIGTPAACDKLIARLKTLEPKYEDDPQIQDYCNKIAQALIATEQEKALEVAVDFCIRQEILGQFQEKFRWIYLPEGFVRSCINKIRKEIQRIKLSFSLLGDKQIAQELLHVISHMRTPEVIQLCQEILKTVSKKTKLASEAEQVLQDVPPMKLYSPDHILQKLAITRNVPEMICHIAETGATGELTVITQNAECKIQFQRGDAISATVPNYFLEREDAFYWCFILKPQDVCEAYFQPSNTYQTEPQILKPMELLLSEAIAQRETVHQIAANYLAPDSRFKRKSVNPVYTNFRNTENPEQYSLVWQSLSDTVDLDTLALRTRLPKYELYKILLYFVKRNMLQIEGQADLQSLVSLQEGLSMTTLNLSRIEKRPVLFNLYKATAEICSDLANKTQDEVVKFALNVLRKYLLDYYTNRKVLAAAELQICNQAISLLASYIHLQTSEAKDELLNFIKFSFEEEEVSLRPEPAIPESQVLPTNTVEKLENIAELDSSFLEEDIEGMFSALDSVLGSALGHSEVESQAGSEGQWSGLTESEEAMIKDLFDNIALAYVKPLKDFIRELYRNSEQQRPTSLEWYEMIEPIFTLLSGASARMGYKSIAEEVSKMEQIVKQQVKLAQEQQRDSFLPEAAYPITEAYQKLCELQPKTFALLVSEEDLADRKDALIVKFILKQVPDMTDKLLSKILFAGLNSFDKFMQTRPDEIAALTGTSKEIANDIMEKFYHYRKVYYKDSPDFWESYLSMFELNLNLLREIQLEIELLSGKVTSDEEISKTIEKLNADRQRALWSLFILLCIREEYDLIETIQQSIFEEKLQLLDQYYAELLSSQAAAA
ncbi:MAG: hypothetical protein RMM17_10525 [Acidobacteriota bacterium]|nr:hypothetical protein [Blastocatellia bacterium]MDW8413105.1 hypothetical protein [Acidobacteriota bacterium]